MRTAALAAALLAVLALRPAGAQSGTPPASDSAPRLEGLSAILLGELALAAEGRGDSAAAARTARAASLVARGYRAAGRTPAIADEVIARAASTHLAGAPALMTAASLQRVDEQVFRLLLLQTAQSARLVEQHDRIIALLEQLAARR